MERRVQPAADIIELGAASDLTQGMMGDQIEGFERQPDAGLADV